MDFRFDLVIIGGGIVGLATALEATRRFRDRRIAVLEKEGAVACHQTSHNSGVIHSGIYYKPGSLKAKNCVAGAATMVQFCREHNIVFEICGKVVAATVQSQLHELEPYCSGIAALHVPGTGITDYSAVAKKYADLVGYAGGKILTECAVESIKKNASEVIVETTRGSIQANFAFNCAGLHSDRVMRLAGDAQGLKIVPFRGEYYEIVPERRKLVPEIQAADLVPAGAGVRAQALDRRGALLDDFCIVRSERMIHVCNVPSPAATASLVIGKQIVDML
ncbi:MAG: hypothetical protein DMG19_13485, partial [Acidobacteria bacterium]